MFVFLIIISNKILIININIFYNKNYFYFIYNIFIINIYSDLKDIKLK